MEPEPFVIDIPVPAVKVALVRVFPVVLPIRSCPSVYVVCPVPPYRTPTAVACHTPVAIVPTEVKEEVRTPVPRVVPDNTLVPAIWYTLPVDRLRFPVLKVVPEPERGSKVMLPVVDPPKVRVAFWRDCIDPAPERTSPVVVADTEAVGVPEFMFRTANFAEVVA